LEYDAVCFVAPHINLMPLALAQTRVTAAQSNLIETLPRSQVSHFVQAK
jgi:hypothetical protein